MTDNEKYLRVLVWDNLLIKNTTTGCPQCKFHKGVYVKGNSIYYKKTKLGMANGFTEILTAFNRYLRLRRSGLIFGSRAYDKLFLQFHRKVGEKFQKCDDCK